MRRWNPDLWRQLPRHAQVVAAGCAGAIALVVLVILSSLWSWHSDNSQRLEDIEPRIARLLGYIHSFDQLDVAAAHTHAQLASLTYPAGSDSAATGANVQQQLRHQLEAAGLSVTGSQVLAAQARQGFEEIRVNLTASGSMEALDQALLALQQMRPLVLVNSLELSPARARRNDPEQNVMLQLGVSVVRLL
ncbi:MAG: type II secretion system protein GspM [Porticoccaceae bacterium]